MTNDMFDPGEPRHSGRPGPYDAYGPQDDVPGRGPARGGRPPYDDPRLGEEFGGGRGGGRFSAFPFPTYSTRTRRGTQVSVGGCCLPIPIGCLALTLTAATVAATRLVRHLP